MFELGLFMSRLGRDRTFIILDIDRSVEIPSDLDGITFAIYSYKDLPEESLQGALGPASHSIRKEIRRLGPFNNRGKELGMLYRMLNACTYPNYSDVQGYTLRESGVSFQDREAFGTLDDVVEFVEDLFKDFVYPLLSPAEARSLRIYFAYYLGDGVKLRAIGEHEPFRYCCDINEESRNGSRDDENGTLEGQFVIGISNPTVYPQEGWRIGRAIRGFKEYANGTSPSSNASSGEETASLAQQPGIPASNCAKVFANGRASYKGDLRTPTQRVANYDTESELSVYTVPVEWRTSDGTASLGVLTVSSMYPDYIPDRLRTQVQLLGNLVGFVFSLHADQILDELDKSGTAHQVTDGRDQNELWLDRKVGINVLTNDREKGNKFVVRAITLRQRIAAHFENAFVDTNIHHLNETQESKKQLWVVRQNGAGR